VNDSLTLLAVGFSNGALLLLRGEVSKDRGTKIKLLIEPDEVAPITGLAFKVVKLKLEFQTKLYCMLTFFFHFCG